MAIVDEIKKFKEAPDLGKVGNDILYDMCRKYPYHTDESEIIAKVWLIGRSYAVSIERSKKRKEEKASGQVSDDFYADTIAPYFKGGFDKEISEARGLDILTDKNLCVILEVHKKTVDFISRITGDDKRSFASKYLHFHFPNLFFIYDSRASKAIKDIFKEINGDEEEVKEIIKIKEIIKKCRNYDKIYADFFIKCFLFQKFCENEKNNVPLTMRQVDSFLIRRANEKIRRR